MFNDSNRKTTWQRWGSNGVSHSEAGLKQMTESDHEVAVKAAIVAFGVIQFFKKE